MSPLMVVTYIYFISLFGLLALGPALTRRALRAQHATIRTPPTTRTRSPCLLPLLPDDDARHACVRGFAIHREQQQLPTPLASSPRPTPSA